ncbi:MAG TPA: YihY/virulence factor BrkB family protein [Acidimicrobiales bacterium]|nr:YihY/virulence factor BrkB family protein [Acidimicrobiales bacterium]
MEEREKLVTEERTDVEVAEENAEAAAKDALRRHPLLSRVLRVGGGVVHEQAAESVGLAAAGATFWVVISAFPTAIAAVSLFGLVVSPESVATDLASLASGAPASLGSLVTDQLRRVAASDHASLSLGLAASLVFALWSASAGVYNLDRAIRVAYGLTPQRYADARGRALLGAVALVVFLGVGALAISAAIGRSRAPVVVLVGVPVLLVVVAVGVAALYRFSVGTSMGTRALAPGAIASSLGVVAALVGFGAYVAWSKHYTAVYGVFAGAVIGMLGTYVAVYVILLGAVLNAQLQLAAKRPPP